MTIERVNPVTAEAKRRVFMRVGWKIAAVLVVDFLLLRIWAPNLINLHRDWALAAAMLCLVGAAGATLWLVFQLWTERSNWVRTHP